MRVLLTTDTVGGVWTFALELAQSLSAEVHIATMGRALSESQREAARPFRLYESEYKLEWMPGAWGDVDRAGRWLLDLEARIAPDLVHLNSLVNADLPWRAPVVVTAHSCVLSWWEAVKGEAAPPEWDEYRRRVSRSLRAAALVTAPSGWMMDCVRRFYAYSGEGMVIPNGRAVRKFPKLEKEPFILAAGRMWDEAKNLKALEAVAPRLEWPIRIAGEGSALGLLDPEQLAQWYARASIYAWPAKYEPFGLSVLEAALAGCALVLGDIPSLRENWEGAAEFAGSDDELAGKLRALTADSARRAELASRSAARARLFSVERMAAGYTEAYRKTLSVNVCA